MVDTNIFDAVVAGEISFGELLKRGPVYITHIQRKQLLATPEGEKKISLLKVLDEIETQELDSATARAQTMSLSGYDPWSIWDDVNAVYKDLNPRQQKNRDGDWSDALISEAARSNDLLLLTADYDLYAAHIAAGGRAELHRPGTNWP